MWGAMRFWMGVAAFALAMGAHAQGNGDYDYYRKYNTPPKDLLYNVEKYHLLQGIEKLGRHQFKYARDDFAFMLHYFPNHPRALLLMMDTLFQAKQPKMFEQYMSRALQLFPETPSTHVVDGIYKHRMGQYDAAVQAYGRGLDLKEDSADAHYNLALTYVEMKKLDKANAHAQRAYALNHSLPGLRRKLEQLKAWDPADTSLSDKAAAEAKPSTEAGKAGAPDTAAVPPAAAPSAAPAVQTPGAPPAADPAKAP
jgi:tetratricopeptide (TPR) repeat protein